MQSVVRSYKHTIAKLGQMPLCWLAFDSLSNDRTPEGYISQGSPETRV